LAPDVPTTEEEDAMSGSVNRATLLGRLGQDPEVRETREGKKVVYFSLATHQKWRDQKSGAMQERTEWHRVVIFNERLAEIAEAYLAKGRRVYLEGQLQTRQWTDPEGHQRVTTEIVLSGYNAQLTLLDGQGAAGDDEAA
jgi:single-strand DNA-binding protein